MDKLLPAPTLDHLLPSHEAKHSATAIQHKVNELTSLQPASTEEKIAVVEAVAPSGNLDHPRHELVKFLKEYRNNPEAMTSPGQPEAHQTQRRITHSTL